MKGVLSLSLFPPPLPSPPILPVLGSGVKVCLVTSCREFQWMMVMRYSMYLDTYDTYNLRYNPQQQMEKKKRKRRRRGSYLLTQAPKKPQRGGEDETMRS